jgi:hypothetical protein
MTDDPVVIGGTGGSGTRAVARIVLRTGRFMGSRLNRSEDTLDIADFDWRWGPDFVRSGASPEMWADFDAALRAHLAQRPDGARWGWKHPQSYLLLPFLAERFPDLRFIHVVRDGRDIALARNHNQLELYGDPVLGPGDPADAVRRIRFWAWANDRAADQRLDLLPDRSLCVRLEDLCRDPEPEVRRILRLVEAGEVDPLPVDEIAPPASLGRGVADPLLARRLEVAAEGTLRRFGYLDAGGAA